MPAFYSPLTFLPYYVELHILFRNLNCQLLRFTIGGVPDQAGKLVLLGCFLWKKGTLGVTDKIWV
jgi:hypothetical protein